MSWSSLQTPTATRTAWGEWHRWPVTHATSKQGLLLGRVRSAMGDRCGKALVCGSSARLQLPRPSTSSEDRCLRLQLKRHGRSPHHDLGDAGKGLVDFGHHEACNVIVQVRPGHLILPGGVVVVGG